MKRIVLIIALLFIGTVYGYGITPFSNDKVTLSKVDQLRKTVSDLEQELIHIVKEEEKNYQWINELQETLVSLKKKQIESTNALKYQQQKLTKLLRAFRTLSTNTSLTVFVSCKSREDILYTAIMLEKTIHHLKEMALDLRQELSEIENSKEQIGFAEENLAQSLKTIHQKKNNLEYQLKINSQKLKEFVQTSVKSIEEKESVSSIKGTEAVKSLSFKKEGLSKEKLDFSWPVVGRIIRPYGNHPDFLSKGKGVVIEIDKTSPVFCPQEGLVVRVTESESIGYTIVITHPQGYQTTVVGVDSLHCYQGQKLQQGQIVGIIEKTLLKPPQLYIQLKCYGRWENPLLCYLKD